MGGGVPSGEVFLDEEPFVAVLTVLAVEGLQLVLRPQLLVDAGVEVVDITE